MFQFRQSDRTSEADRLKREEQLKRQKEQQNLTQEMLSMEMNGADADSFSGYASAIGSDRKRDGRGI